jgi:DNA-binding response OmpR family regulator
MEDGSVNILICEDDEDLAGMLAEKFLDYFDDSVCTLVANGDLAAKELDTTAYDFINLDMNVPGMKGHQIIRHVRDGQGPNRKTPIILLSAEVDDSTEEFANQSVVKIHKPVHMEKLLEIAAVMTNTFPKPLE